MSDAPVRLRVSNELQGGKSGSAGACRCLVFPGASPTRILARSLSSPADYRSLYSGRIAALIYTVQDLQNIGQNLSSNYARPMTFDCNRYIGRGISSEPASLPIADYSTPFTTPGSKDNVERLKAGLFVQRRRVCSESSSRSSVSDLGLTS